MQKLNPNLDEWVNEIKKWEAAGERWKRRRERECEWEREREPERKSDETKHSKGFCVRVSDRTLVFWSPCSPLLLCLVFWSPCSPLLLCLVFWSPCSPLLLCLVFCFPRAMCFCLHFDMCFCCSICSCLCPSPVTVIGNFPPFLVLTYFPLCFSLCVIGLCIYTRWLFFDSLSFRLVSWSQLFSWFLVGLGLFLVPVFACFWSCSLHSVLPTWFCCVLSCKSCFFLLPLHFVPCSLWSSPTKPGCCFIPLSCLCQKSLRPQGNMSICGKRGIRCLL